jgi:hypothetical protein
MGRAIFSTAVTRDRTEYRVREFRYWMHGRMFAAVTSIYSHGIRIQIGGSSCSERIDRLQTETQ